VVHLLREALHIVERREIGQVAVKAIASGRLSDLPQGLLEASLAAAM
jgi:hypothetical protein